MCRFSFSSTSKKNELSGFLFHFCFSIFSHPLYFSYFIFFSPYLLKLISFLSPLFITTTLLLLALLTVSPNLVLDRGDSEFSESKVGFLLSICQTLKEWLQSKAADKDEEIGYLEEFEAYLVMFQASIFQALEPKSEENCSEGFEATEAECSGKGRDHADAEEEPNVENLDENPIEKNDKVEAIRPIAEVKSLENLFQENEEFEDVFQENEELEDAFHQKEDNYEVKQVDPELDKAEASKEKLPLKSGLKVSTNGDGEYAAAVAMKVKSQRLEASLGSPENNWVYNEPVCSNLGSFGSMRKEKEWRRTLACKLFEERHNVNGSEGMDMLWETYETESNKVLEKSKTKKGKKSEVEYNEEDDEDEEEEEGMDGKLCCLQALKFSAGKMNLGMGRPNLLKISKAFKGMGWLHHVGRHGRKGNH